MNTSAESIQLSNGTTLIHKLVTHNNIFAVRAFYRNGAATDPEAQAGLTNMVIRLLLKGTRNRDAERIALDFESQGANVSTEIQKDYAGVSLLCTSDSLVPCIDVLGDVLSNPMFDPGKTAIERDAILKQIREEEDHTLAQTFRLFQKQHYGAHPYGYPVMGLVETVSQLDQSQVCEHYQKLCKAEDLVIVIVGSTGIGELAALLEPVLPRPNNNGNVLDQPEIAQAPAPPSNEVVTNTRDTEAEWLVMGYSAPSVTHPDSIAFRVLDSILGGSMSSRLFTEVREKRGLAYQIGTDFPVRAGAAYFAVFLGTAPANHEEAVKTILGEIERIRIETPPNEEVENAKRYLRGTFIMSQETNRGQAGLLGRSEILGLGLDYGERWLEKIAAVTPEEVRAVAEKYLTHYTMVVTAPK